MARRNVRKSKRSGDATCDVCGRVRPLVEHHIHGREVRNWRGAWNVAWVCPNCHDDVHAGDKVIEGWFNVGSGRELVWRGKGEPHKLGPGASPHTYK